MCVLVPCACVVCACVQDYFFHKEGVNNGGNRYATVLTYLNDVEEGGETVSYMLLLI